MGTLIFIILCYGPELLQMTHEPLEHGCRPLRFLGNRFRALQPLDIFLAVQHAKDTFRQ